MALLNQESSLMEIVKLIGSDVLPDDQKLVLEIAKVIRLGFLQQNAFHKDDTCVIFGKTIQDDGSDSSSLSKIQRAHYHEYADFRIERGKYFRAWSLP